MNYKCYILTMEKLDISSFKNAINSLNSILIRYQKDNYDIDIRDAVIQRFEYTYSLAIKMMNRYINLYSSDTISDMTFNEIIRKANKLGLLKNDLEKWTEYRQKRNMTSHTYDEKVANQVVEIIPDFKQDAEFLYNSLESKL